MSSQYTLRQGTQMYCFAYELRTFQYSTDDVLQWCGHFGVGDHRFGLGAPQNRGAFPEATNEFERYLKSAIDRFGLTPGMYGAYMDPLSHPTDDEKFEFSLVQLKSARKLGFPLMRTWWVGPAVMDRLLPYAEKYRIQLAYEIHAPMVIGKGHTQTDQCIAYVRKKSSPYLGILPDGGAFATKTPCVVTNYLIHQLRVSPAIVQQAQRWHDDKVPRDKALAEAKKLDPPDIAAFTVQMTYGHAPAGDPNELRSLMPFVMEIHGKNFGVKNGQVDEIPYDDIVRILVEAKWPGSISTEYEAHLYAPEPYLEDAATHVRDFQAMIQRMAKKYSSA